MNYLEIVGTAIGLIYLWLEYRASAWLWVASILMPAIYLKVYYDAGLYADLGISIYYILASLYGLIVWLIGIRRSAEESYASDQKQDSAGISRTPKSKYIPLLFVTGLLFLIIGEILSRFTDSSVPWADAFTTALSIVAMWMLARKYVEQWIVWIVADIGCAILYGYKELWFTGGLYFIYAVIAWLGYKKWIGIMSAGKVEGK